MMMITNARATEGLENPNRESESRMDKLSGDRPLTVSVYKSHEWPQVAPLWADLARLSPYTTFFLSLPWVESWMEVFGSILSASILVFRNHEKPVGICTLVNRLRFRGPIPVRCVYLNTAGEDEADSPCIEFNNLLCLADSEQGVAHALVNYLREKSWDEFVMDGFCQGPGLLALKTAFAGLKQVATVCPSYYVDLAHLRVLKRDYADTLLRKVRQQLRQNLKRYSESGVVQLEIADDPIRAVQWLDQLAELHQKAWTAKGQAGAFASSRFVMFHRSLIRRSFCEGAIQLVKATAGDHAIGLKYNFIHRDIAYSYQAGLNYESDKRLKPGFVLLTLAIQHGLERGLKEYHLMAGRQPYKMELATEYRELTWLKFQRPRIQFWLIARSRDAKRLAEKAIRMASQDPRSFARAVWRRSRTSLNRIGYSILRSFGVKQCIMYSHALASIPDVQQPPEFSLQWLKQEDVHLLSQIWPLDLEEMKGRLERGDRCYLGCVGGVPVHYSWVQRSGMHTVGPGGFTQRIAPGEFWIYHCRTTEEMRGRKIYPFVLAHILREHREEGFSVGWIYTTRKNLSSQRGIERAGFEIMGRV